MSSKEQQLEEYEKNYLKRVEEKEKTPPDLQNLIFQMTKEVKKHEKKDYIGLCVVCTKPVDRGEMVYKNNHLFHPGCFNQHGNEYQPTTKLMIEGRRANVDLAYFKNLKVRISNQSSGKKPSVVPTKRSSTKPKKKKTSVKRKVSKRKPAKRRPKRKAHKKRRKSRPARKKVFKKRSRAKSRKRRR